MIVVVAGVPGSGKTSVIKKAQEYVGFRYVNYGDLFLSVAEEEYGIKNRDEIRTTLSPSQYMDLHRKASERLMKIAQDRLVVVDTHYLVATPAGFIHGFPKFVLEKMDVAAWVLIEATEEEIASRRKRDEGVRERGKGIEGEIALHQEMNRVAAVLYSFMSGGAVYIIRNREGEMDEAARELAGVLRACNSG